MSLFDEIAAILEPHLSREYNSRIGREDWNEQGLKSVKIGEGNDLYIAIKNLIESRERKAFLVGRIGNKLYNFTDYLKSDDYKASEEYLK